MMHIVGDNKIWIICWKDIPIAQSNQTFLSIMRLCIIGDGYIRKEIQPWKGQGRLYVLEVIACIILESLNYRTVDLKLNFNGVKYCA